MTSGETKNKRQSDPVAFTPPLPADSCQRPAAQTRRALRSEYSDGRFVQTLYRIFLEASATASQINTWRHALAGAAKKRFDLLRGMIHKAFQLPATSGQTAVRKAKSCRILGSFETVTASDWNTRADELSTAPSRGAAQWLAPARFHIGKPYQLVTAIASLYKGGAYIEQFLENICAQSIFSEGCELIIIDANSPENEAATIGRYTRRHKNIVYRRMDHRIGIYEAWNAAVGLSRGAYLTTTNLDDLRRHDSFELQAETLEALPFVDVVYQDFYYSLDPALGFDGVAAFGYKSGLPVITPQNLITFNSPHNAPMWRKALHDELGGFDSAYTSAGDCEFWLRCLAAGKTFYKRNEPHVVYYQNPDGVSTRPGSRGGQEAKRVQKKYARELLSENLVCERAAFRQRLGLSFESPGGNDGRSRYNEVHTALRTLAVQSKRAANPMGGPCACS